MKEKYIKAYMKMAYAFAETSEAVRRKVGALIVKPGGGTIAEGVNGMPPGWETEECEYREYYNPRTSGTLNEPEYSLIDEAGKKYKLTTKKDCRHAEVAALEKLWLSSETSEGRYMFVTTAPCKDCAMKIAIAKIAKVYYSEIYRSEEGLKYLAKKNIPTEVVDLAD